MSYIDDEYDDYQSEYELGLEGEYDGDPPPGYESWAEWHYEHGDELPTDEDYGIFSDGDEQTTGYQPDEMAFDCNTGIYYNRRTGKRYNQRQLDAECDRETEEIIALAKQIEAQNKRQEEQKRKLISELGKNNLLVGKHVNTEKKVEKTVQELATEQGVHPDMFSRTDSWCWKWICDYNTWLCKRPRVYMIYIIGICTIVMIILMLFGI